MNWNLWLWQIGAITRLELKRFVLARRWVGVYILALAPVFLMFVQSRLPGRQSELLNGLSEGYANLFQLFIVRFGLFIACAAVFSQLFRGDILEKTLHLYLLTPARREIIAIGKYVAGVTLVATLFTASTIAAHLLAYSNNPAFNAFFFEGSGFAHLARYVTVTILASIAYGAIFLLVGLLFKNPGPPAFFLFLWESLNFALPSVLQNLSIVHYLVPILAIHVDRGAFAVVTEPVSPFIGIPVLITGTLIFIAASGWVVRYTQITYSTD